MFSYVHDKCDIPGVDLAVIHTQTESYNEQTFILFSPIITGFMLTLDTFPERKQSFGFLSSARLYD